ncbi:MAG: BBP7 family outer membrane beta-barrel protein [Planctomycetota bacterium]
MKTNFKRLAMMALLLSGTSAAALADDGSVVADLPGFGEEAYFHADGAYVSDTAVSDLGEPGVASVGDEYVLDAVPAAASDSVRVGDEPLSVISATPASIPMPSLSHAPQYAPIGATELQPTAFMGNMGASSCDSCDGACDGSCDSACGKKKSGFFDIFDRCDDCTWASAEVLLWYAQDREMIPLVTVGAPGSDPTLPTGTVAFGDDIEGDLSIGFRGDYGRWLSENVGIGGRFWILSENEDSYSAAGNGTGNSIARPFFNLAVPGEDTVIINNDGTGALAQFAGSVSASSTLDIWAAEAYSRVKLSYDQNHRFEFIGGYSHFQVDDELRIASTSIENANARVTSFTDRFEAENRFHGGQVGFEMIISRGKWTARSLTKVHLGNMNQMYTISGTTSDQLPPGGVNNFPVGMLARGNSGTYEDDAFAFIPEANFKLAYQVRNNMDFSIGYSFMYFDNVALNGAVIDRVISDGATLQTGVVGARPQFVFDDSSLWVQGIDLGLSINY